MSGDTRTQPHNLDAERAVLGTVLVHSDALYEVGSQLEAQHFYRSAHQQIYAAMVGLSERGIPPEFVTLTAELDRRGELESIGGRGYIASLADGTPKETNVTYYAQIVRDMALYRGLIAAGNRVVAAAYDASEDARLVLDDAERALLSLSESVDAGDLQMMDRVVPEAIALLKTIYETKRAVTGTATGLGSLDDVTRGFQPSNLIVLGGRPGEGKSALALQIAWHVAQTQPVAFFSMEMSREELTTRAAAQMARVDHHLMMQGSLGEDDRQRVWVAMNDLTNGALAIDDTAGQTPYQIRSKSKTLQARRGLGLVVVDYLQLLRRPRHANSREEAVSENTWALKVLASELKVPVLALSQLNRASVKEDRRPSLADLRESGAVEQHANVVLLLYKPTSGEPGAPSITPPVELLVAKQRNGRSQMAIDLIFRSPFMRFEEASWQH